MRRIALPLLALAGVFLPAPLPAQAPVAKETILEWDGAPEGHWSLRAPWEIERAPELVRSGSGSLRATLGPPAKWPGINVQEEALANADARALVFQVHHFGEKRQSLRIRIDDKYSKGEEDELYRRTFALDPGWNTVRIPFDEARVQGGGRTIDPRSLTYMKIYVSYPEEDVVLVFDDLHFEVPPRAADPAEARALVKRFARGFRPGRTPTEEAIEGVAALENADVPDRVRVLTRVLERAEDARLIGEVVRVLGTTEDDEAVALLVRAAEKARGPDRWRLAAALGRVRHDAARAWLHGELESSDASPDLTAAVLAFTRHDDPEALPHLDASLGGSWQLQAARIEALKRQSITRGFLPLVGFLDAERVRVRDDARRALVALSGRDLGFSKKAWEDWYRANEGRLRGGEPLPGGDRIGRSPYGSYYGIPLLPGRIAFVIDLSGSMEAELAPAAKAYVEKAKHLDPEEVKTRLDLARAEAIHAIKGLPETAEFQIVFFNDRARLWSRNGPKRATSSTKNDAIRTLESYSDPGYTNLYDGLVRAFDPDPDAPFRRTYAESIDTLYLLSDGDPSRGEITDYRHLVADIFERNRVRRIRIHTIGLGVRDHQLLRGLAAVTDGQYVDLAR